MLLGLGLGLAAWPWLRPLQLSLSRLPAWRLASQPAAGPGPLGKEAKARLAQRAAASAMVSVPSGLHLPIMVPKPLVNCYY